MQTFSTFNQELEEFAGSILRAAVSTNCLKNFKSQSFDNIYVSHQLRKLIPIEELRDAGSFFTGEPLANLAVDALGDLSDNDMILDPACGAGNLLIAASKKLPVFKKLSDTIACWGECLAGFDLHQEFIDATKLRLILEAVNRGAMPKAQNTNYLKKLLPNIRVGDAFKYSDMIQAASHIILNPPFTQIRAGGKLPWAEGNVNSAAVFTEFCLKYAQVDCKVSVILPEVLRSGSRYAKWRALVSQKLQTNIKSFGKFDTKTDVDVFLISGKVGSWMEKAVWVLKPRTRHSVCDFFDISIGPLVAYRDKEKGGNYPYIYPRLLPAWAAVDVAKLKSKRKYSGRLINPPFVAVRRTSSPTDKFRATATLILGKKPVAVENHLIVLKPKVGGIMKCRRLLKVLINGKTNDFLNKRIRCRHLTVTAVKEIPWLGNM